MISLLRSAATVLGVALVSVAGVSSAQTFYKWTDEAGVVHFSDAAPPAQARGVEERKLPPPPQSASAESPGAASAEGEQADGKPAVADGAPGEGPARVIIVSRKNPRTGPSAMHIAGEVKNVGGSDAGQVTVTISAADSGQGNPCLNEQTDVAPSTLRPGQTGKFDVEVDSPCLNGDPRVDVEPVWQ